MRVVLVGGRGFFGSAVAQQLAEHDVVTVDRGEGGSSHVQADILDTAALVRACDGADCVVNFVGLSPLFQPRGASYEQVHVEGAGSVVLACEQAGVGHVVQVSALGASMDASTAFLRTKAAGEQRVRDLSSSLIVRPSMLYDQDSEVVQMLRSASRLRVFFRTSAMLQPVFRADVASVVADAVVSGRTGTLEVAGPDLLTLSDFAQLIFAHEGRSCVLLPSWLARLGASALAILPRTRIGFDQVRGLDLDNVLDPSSGASQIVTQTSIPDWLEGLK